VDRYLNWLMSRRWLRIVGIWWLLAWWSILAAGWPTSARADIYSLAVRQGHPVLFVDSGLLAQLRAKTSQLQRFHDLVRSRYEPVRDANDIGGIRSYVEGLVSDDRRSHLYFIRESMAYALDAVLNEDTLSREYGRQYVQAILALDLGSPTTLASDQGIRGRLFALGMLYDWLHTDLSASVRAQVRQRIVDYLDLMDAKYHYLSRPNYTGGHSRTANTVALVALLPIYHDVGQESQALQDRYSAFLQMVVDNWRNGYNKCARWINEGGGHNFGWAYGVAYTDFTPYAAWYFATDEEDWFEQWHADSVYWYLYALRNTNRWGDVNRGGYDNFPYWGDVWDTIFTHATEARQWLIHAYRFNDDRMRWLYNQLSDGDIDVWEMLYMNFGPDAGTAPTGLPLSRLFPNSGYVLMRDSWDPASNCLVVFKSSSFYMENHQHKDDNAFTVYYKGPLAIDSGLYNLAGGYASSHWLNYYTRTVAHNAILVYDPNERFVRNGVTLSNDGGQRFFASAYPTYDQIVEGGENHLDGMVRYEDRDVYVYAVGDASKAYAASKVQEYTRSMVYLRGYSQGHPLILVYDKVAATSSAYEKTYLLHTINTPSVQGTVVTVSVDDGLDATNKASLVQTTLLPLNAKIVVRGGRNNDADFWVADDGTGRPRNYNEGVQYDATGTKAVVMRQGGQWRIEVSPTTPRGMDWFLHTLAVVDGGSEAAAPQSSYVHSDNLDGAAVDGGDKRVVVLFKKTSAALNDTVSLPAGFQPGHALLLGLEPGARYRVVMQAGALVVTRSAAGLYTASSQGSLWVALGAGSGQLLPPSSFQIDAN